MRSIISLIVLATFLNLSRSESNNQQDIRWLEDEGCSRVGSRLVRNFLNKAVFPRLPFPADQLPTTCQFHPALDRYKQQEGNKTEISRGDIQCNICGKHFRTEFYLDKHMHNMHKDTLQGGTQGVCLADLCPMFGCHNDHQSQFQQLYRSTDQRIINNNNNNNDKKSFNLDETCTSSSLERQQYQCESLMRKCFADLRDKALQKQFKMNICGELQCINGILKGSITQRGLTAEYMRGIVTARELDAMWETNDDMSSSSLSSGASIATRSNGNSNSMDRSSKAFLFWMLRMIIMTGILCFIIGYIYFANIHIRIQLPSQIGKFKIIRWLSNTFTYISTWISWDSFGRDKSKKTGKGGVRKIGGLDKMHVVTHDNNNNNSSSSSNSNSNSNSNSKNNVPRNRFTSSSASSLLSSSRMHVSGQEQGHEQTRFGHKDHAYDL